MYKAQSCKAIKSVNPFNPISGVVKISRDVSNMPGSLLTVLLARAKLLPCLSQMRDGLQLRIALISKAKTTPQIQIPHECCQLSPTYLSMLTQVFVGPQDWEKAVNSIFKRIKKNLIMSLFLMPCFGLNLFQEGMHIQRVKEKAPASLN